MAEVVVVLARSKNKKSKTRFVVHRYPEDALRRRQAGIFRGRARGDDRQCLLLIVVDNDSYVGPSKKMKGTLRHAPMPKTRFVDEKRSRSFVAEGGVEKHRLLGW